jgi:ribosomal protein L13E
MMTIKPVVFKKDGKERHGRGFSREELKKAGLSLREALKLSIPVDSRRKTAHKENVSTIRKFLKSKKKASKPKKRRKKLNHP